MFAYGEYALL